MVDEKDLFFGVQHTLSQEFEFFGLGLLSGQISTIRVKPTQEDSGIIFKSNGEYIKLSVSTTYPGFHNLTLKTSSGDIMYIEHLLSAFWGLGVDNAIVEISGSEVPFFDGSALIFSERLLQIGVEPQNSLRKYCIIKDKVKVEDERGYIVAEPSGEFIVTAVYRSPTNKEEEFTFTQDMSYADEIAIARTFIYEDELKNALEAGLFKGGNEDSAIVFRGDTPLNTELRFDNERARHKILDFLGDIFVLNLRILGKFFLYNSSHKLSRKMLNVLKYEIL